MQPIKKELPLFREATLLVSPETAVKAVPVMEHVAQGKPPELADVATMVTSLAEDLKAQGLHLSSEDIRAVQERAKNGLTSPTPSKIESPEVKPIKLEEMPDVDLHEYQQVLNDFVKNYGIDTRSWNTISGLLVSSDAMGQGLNAYYRKKFQTAEGWTNIMDTFTDKISRGVLGLDKKTPKEFFQELKGWDKKAWKSKGSRIGKLAFDAAWPVIVSPAYWFLDRQAVQIAGKMFMAERGKLQEQVNNRIADSLYMRNFEFLHDQSAAEMMQVITDGKDSTMNLMSVIYEQLIPKKWSQWISVFSQGIVNKWDLYAAAFKKVLLDTRIQKNATVIQKQNAEVIAQWDKVNTKLMSTIQGLETVRTAGNAEAGSDVLYSSLADRDFVDTVVMREKRMQDKAINKLFDFLDISVPLVTEGFDFAKKMKSGVTQDMDGNSRKINAEDMFSQIFQGYFRVTGSQAEQKMLRHSFLELTHLYTDSIIPDIQAIKRMDELLGPYDKIDHPQGLLERARAPVTSLKNFDIHVENLKFKNILHNVNLDIPQGSFVTIKGPSGIGKSTLFRHLVNLYSGDEGSVTYGGVEIDKIKKYGDESLYSKIAYANQSPQYFEDMTLRDNLLLWTKKDIPNDRLEGVLRDLRLDKLIDRLDSKEKHFSGGEMRRIGIARALLKDPKVLFLDEPTANLDGASTLQVMKIIQELRKKRPDMTVVAITHDPVFEKIAEKIVDFEKINKKPEGTALGDNQVLEAVAKPS